MKNFFLFLFLFSFVTLNAQEYKSFTIENISEETVWNAVYKTIQELKMPHVSVNKNTGKGETGYYNYTALMIKNRCKFRFKYEAGNLTVSVFGRQYMSDKGWADNMLPMTKKQASNILEPIEKRITELTKNTIYEPKEEKPIATTSQQTIPHASKKGIYDDFSVFKTGDPQLELIAAHKNGAILSFDLYDDQKTVKTLIFQPKHKSEILTVFFNDKGLPTELFTQNFGIKISPVKDRTFKLQTYDQDGNEIDNSVVELPITSVEQIGVQSPNEKIMHGPAAPEISYFPETDILSTAISNASTITKGLVCGFGIAGGLVTAPSGPGAVALIILSCESIYLDLVAMRLGEDHFAYDELMLASDITGLATPKGAATGWVNAASMGMNAITSTKNSVDDYSRFKEKYFKTPTLTISGATKIRSGAFGEYGYSLNVYASSNYPNEPIQWDALNDELKIEQIYIGDQEYISGLYGVRVFAKEKDWASYPVLEASLVVDNKVITREIKLEIVKPNYYYLNSCNNCGSDPKYRQACEIQLKQCINTLKKDADNIYFVIDNNDNILSSNKDLNNARLAFIKSSNSENHGFIPLVKEATCSFSCEGLSDKETIISLAHEGMEFIRKTESRIEVLQRQITENNYAKIGADINSEKDFIKRIRKEYGDRINKIAEKGTIRMASRKSDPAKYYQVNGVRVVGAHWQRQSPSILIDVDLSKNPIPKTVNDEQFYETAGDIRFQYLDSDGKIIEKGTAIFTQFALFVETFEKIELIDFNSSLSVLRKKTSDDGLDTFY
ncbi:MAG: hypothetical protein AB7S72_17990 [Draconibacterium sp.]